MDAKPQIDPYYLWLGIPPAEQPPNHYRLLGVTLFEANSEVIDAAAFRQTMHLRTYAVGPHSDHSQKLLNEVAAAKICLSRPEKKAAYDAELRARLSPPKPPLAPPPGREKSTDKLAAPAVIAAKPMFGIEPPQRPPASVQPRRPKQTQPLAELAPLPPLPTSQTLPTLRPRSKRAKPAAWQWIAAAGAGTVVVLLGVAMFGGPGRSDQSTALVPARQQSEPISDPPVSKPAPPGPTPSPELAPPAPTPPSAPPPPALPAVAPFDAEQAKKHQEAWAAYSNVPVEYENTIGMKFVLIPPGEFTMGSTQAEIEAALVVAGADGYWKELIQSEGPAHKVILTQPIYLGIHEVTQKEYMAVMGKNPSHFAPMGAGNGAINGADTSTHPVETVSWTDAAEFCARLSEKEKLKPYYARSGESVTMLEGAGYRLPTEAEWEFGCRAGTTTRFWVGNEDNQLVQIAWFGSHSGSRTHAVGMLKPNPFGLYDIHGNVWEWVQDWWESDYYSQFQGKTAPDPSGPSLARSRHAIRGGSWGHVASKCRAAGRFAAPSHFLDLGFRVALTVDAVKAAIAERRTTPAPATVGWHGWPAEAPPPAIAPFDTATAKNHQAAWAKYLQVDVEYENTIGMKFALIPPGEFQMGSTAEEIEAALAIAGGDEYLKEHIRSEAPQHNVILTQPVYFGVGEVTQRDYEAVMGINPSHFARRGAGKDVVVGLDTSMHPVEMVSWNDAAEFCSKLSEKENLKPFYFRSDETVTMVEGAGYRLPTEAEWEFACRAGTTTKYWIGDRDDQIVQTAWTASNSARRTHPVGELRGNPFGLYDVHGNIWEWVQDYLELNYYMQFHDEPATNPRGPISAGSGHVGRGGDWLNPVSYCRASNRTHCGPTFRNFNVGFRVALPVDVSRAGR